MFAFWREVDIGRRSIFALRRWLERVRAPTGDAAINGSVRHPSVVQDLLSTPKRIWVPPVLVVDVAPIEVVDC